MVELTERMAFLNEAITLRELKGWPNDPVHNAAVIYEMYGWSFDRHDAAMIRAETRARAYLRSQNTPGTEESRDES